VKFWFRLRIRDVDCDFRLIRREIMDRFGLTEESGLICVELVTKIHVSGCRMREVPVHHFHRMHGRSQFFNISRVLRVLLGMAGLWWRIFVRRDLGRREGQDSVQGPAPAPSDSSGAEGGRAAGGGKATEDV
jgi:hypothetical protein